MQNNISKSLTNQQLEALLQSLQPETLSNETVAFHQARMRDYGNKVLADVGATGSFNMLNPFTRKYLLEFAGKKIKGINGTTINALRRSLERGVLEGEGIPILSRRVNSVFSFAKSYRSSVIARTEVVAASNYATLDAHRQSGLVSRRQWVATNDPRTRDLHAALNGMIVGINEMFSLSSYSAWCPGDFGVAEMDINCRCTTIGIVDLPEGKSQLDYIWKGYIHEIDPWEHELKNRFIKAFDKQERQILLNILRM